MRISDESFELRARRCRRSSEPARIVFGASAFECEVMCISPEGAAVYLRSLVDVPDLVALRLPDGATRAMRCVWQNGPHVGLSTTGPGSARP